MNFNMIAFDADDTLWENEVYYTRAQAKLKSLLEKYLIVEDIHDAVYQTEMRNIGIYGYGIKSFTLSMIETAITLTKGQISSDDIQQIIGFGRNMLTADIQLLPGVKNVLQELAGTYSLMMVTKGDLLDQERKVNHTSIGGLFDYIEIVSEKHYADYQALLRKYDLKPEGFLMVGNSLRSDILPVIQLGGHAVHIPYADTWMHEHIEPAGEHSNSFTVIENISMLPDYISSLER
jgi:putative hydrolase of the HAD superfamily